METKKIFHGPKGDVDRVLISARGNFKCNVRRGLELCKEMGIDCVEFADEQHLTSCIYNISEYDGTQFVRSKSAKSLTLELAPGDAVFLRFQDADEKAVLIDYVLKKN